MLYFHKSNEIDAKYSRLNAFRIVDKIYNPTTPEPTKESDMYYIITYNFDMGKATHVSADPFQMIKWYAIINYVKDISVLVDNLKFDAYNMLRNERKARENFIGKVVFCNEFDKYVILPMTEANCYKAYSDGFDRICCSLDDMFARRDYIEIKPLRSPYYNLLAQLCDMQRKRLISFYGIGSLFDGMDFRS